MKQYFLESSAYAKLFISEQGSTELIQLLEDVDDGNKLLSSLAALEVRSAIRRRHRCNEISSADVLFVLDIIASESRRMVVQPMTAPVVESACIMLDRHPLRTLDALHLGTCLVAAEIMGTEIYFVSADNVLLQAAMDEGLPVLNPLDL